MNHANLKNSILIEANKLDGVKLWPNPTGLAYNGTPSRTVNGDNKPVSFFAKKGRRYLILENPRPIKYGLGKGILDTVGFKAEQIGSVTVPRFIAFDAKTGRDKLSTKQKKFIKLVNKYGGIADEIRDAAEVTEKLKQSLKY